MRGRAAAVVALLALMVVGTGGWFGDSSNVYFYTQQWAPGAAGTTTVYFPPGDSLEATAAYSARNIHPSSVTVTRKLGTGNVHIWAYGSDIAGDSTKFISPAISGLEVWQSFTLPNLKHGVDSLRIVVPASGSVFSVEALK